MGALKLTYQNFEPSLKVVYKKSSFEQNNAQRFLSVDPLADKYAQLTPYNYADNNPIGDLDIDGMQSTETEETETNDSATTTSNTESSTLEELETTESNTDNNSDEYWLGKEGGSFFTNFNLGSFNSSYKGGLMYNKNLSIGSKFEFGVKAGGTFSSISNMNGVNTSGVLFNSTAFSGIRLKYGRLEIDHGITVRGYHGKSEFAGEYNNITGRLRFNWYFKSGSKFSLAWENDTDILTHSEKYWDGAFTNSFQFRLYHDKSDLLFGLRFDMYTPQRPGGPHGNGRGAYSEDAGFLTKPGSLWSEDGLGFYDAKAFKGSYAHLMNFSVTKIIGDMTYSISAGYNSHFVGSFIQGKVHDGVDVPEFDWDPSINHFIAKMSITKTF